MNYKTLLLLLSLVYIGCQNNTNTNQETSVYNIKTVNDRVVPLFPDSIFSDVKYIKLETSDNVLIQKIDKIITDKNIYVLDRKQNTVFIFDFNGKFIDKISKQGNGPDEYNSLSDFMVKDDKIYILSPANFKIMIYDLANNGKYTDYIQLSDYYYQFTQSGNYLYLYSNFASSELKNITILDLASSGIEKKHDFPLEQQGVGYSGFIFSELNNTVYCTFPYEFSIYELHKNNIDKVAEIDFGDSMIPNYLRKESSDKRSEYMFSLKDIWPIGDIQQAIVTNSHYICSVIHMNGCQTLFQSRTSNDYFMGYIMQTDKFPLAMPEIICYNEATVIQKVKYSTVLNTKQYEWGQNIPDEITNGDYEDNPVLAFYTLKEKYR